MSEVTTERPVIPIPEPAPVYPPVSSALHRWTEELRTLLNCYPRADVEDWTLQGHAVLLETNALEEVPALLEHIADTVDIPLHIFPPTGVLENFLPWIRALPNDEPALIYLMPGDWMNPSLPGMEEQPLFAVEPCPDAFLRTLQEVIQGLGARAIVLVTAARGFEQLSPCLRQVGYFDRRIQVPEWTADALVSDFLREIGVALVDESTRAKRERLGALLKMVFPDKRRRSLVVLALKRLARREQRCISFADLVRMAVRGTTEDDPLSTDPSTRHRTAVHEAGHALIAHLDSWSRIAPALCTAIKSRDCHGQLVSAFEAPETRSDDLTIANVRHKIRVKLV